MESHILFWNKLWDCIPFINMESPHIVWKLEIFFSILIYHQLLLVFLSRSF